MQYRPLGNTGLEVSAVALGCWPIAGMTSLDVNEADSIATIQACFELGINFLDTAYCYGAEGQSERLIARALGRRRDEMVLATKGGLHWEGGRNTHDASPQRLRLECEESLRRLETDRVELYYLHAPDPRVPLADSAGALRRLMEEGKVLAAGVSNCTLPQIEEFAAVCPLAAVQPPYNLLMREIERDILPWCREHHVAVVPYWPLMKGLLAGSLRREHVFAPGDGRAKYPQFQGQEWQRNCDLVERLRAIASQTGHTVAQLVINWTITQEGITSALCGAKRPWQIRETAGGADWELTDQQLEQIDRALADRGEPVTRPAV